MGTAIEENRATPIEKIQVALNRFDGAGETLWNAIIDQLGPYFPADTQESNRLLCEVLVYFQAPNAARDGIALLNAAVTQEEQVEYARSLRMLKRGWTMDLRAEYFEWFLRAANYRGGSSFTKTIERIRKEALATLTDWEKTQLAELLDRALIKSIGPSPVSPMPPGLLNRLTKEEIFDMVAYVLSGGNPEDERFR